MIIGIGVVILYTCPDGEEVSEGFVGHFELLISEMYQFWELRCVALGLKSRKVNVWLGNTRIKYFHVSFPRTETTTRSYLNILDFAVTV